MFVYVRMFMIMFILNFESEESWCRDSTQLMFAKDSASNRFVRRARGTASVASDSSAASLLQSSPLLKEMLGRT